MHRAQEIMESHSPVANLAPIHSFVMDDVWRGGLFENGEVSAAWGALVILRNAPRYVALLIDGIVGLLAGGV